MVKEGALTTLAAVVGSSHVLNIFISSNVVAIQELILFQIKGCRAQMEKLIACKIKESTSGKKIDFAHYWNKSVDRIFRPAIQDVGSLQL
ncbi:hypothetical protein Tco_1339343 [Tanacetum coccineum]